MVEVEVRKAGELPEKTTITTADITEIIDKIRDFVVKVRDMAKPGTGQPLEARVDSLNFSIGIENGEYLVSFHSKINIKPKAA